MAYEYIINSVYVIYCFFNDLVNWEINIRYLLKIRMNIIFGRVLVFFWSNSS